jgi:hypothetical protein
MLITEYADSLCNDGRLVKAVFPYPGKPPRRTLYLSERVRVLIDSPWEGMSAKQERWLLMRGWFEHFVDGGLITLRTKPKSQALMARLCPPEDEIWEAREVRPKPSLRVLGSFIARNTFVALAPYGRKELGAKTSKEGWIKALVDYKAEWALLFGELRPMSGKYHESYLTDAVPFD